MPQISMPSSPCPDTTFQEIAAVGLAKGARFVRRAYHLQMVATLRFAHRTVVAAKSSRVSEW